MEKLLGHFETLERGVQDHRTYRELQSLNMATLLSVTFNEGPLSAAKELRALIRYRDRFTNDELKNYFKFTFVRNPWARVYSWYRNILRDDFMLSSRKIPKDCTFDNFLSDFPWQTELRPQLAWIENRSGEIDLDFIGRFENLKQDMVTVTKQLNIEGELPHLIAGNGQHYQDKMSSFSRKMINERYNREIKMFGYFYDDGMS